MKPEKVSWARLLACSGWQRDSQKSYDEDYSYYYSEICGHDYYNIGCWARVSDTEKGCSASGDFGVVWIECDISTYTSCEYISLSDAREVISAIENAENNLLRNGIPFVADYRFHGKYAANKERRNAAIRKKRGLT
ncbi:MAG: hypothetical protein IJ523_10440 [Succinivibrionaceae bacterium]|nr:hypothetical protein [Succinivibrionaceae bacterium]